MKNKVLTIFLLIIVLLSTACNKKEEKQKEITKDKYDYLVLVNKYSKLPDNWEENVELVYAKDAWGEELKVEKKAYDNYLKLKDDLEKEDIYIELDSVYRSVDEQQKLWDDWTVEKGSDYVRKYVAVPGYSEHHTGLAIDICLKKDGELVYENDDMIAETEIFSKIHKKLADYGFILRYLENKDDITGYSYEPWHLRYVGSTKIAKEIMDNNITFEEYLDSIENIKETPEAAKYKLEITLQEYLKKAYDNKIESSRFNVTKIYTKKEEEEIEALKSLNIGEKDVAFEVEYQLLPLENVDYNELIIVDGQYNEKLGWVTDIHRLGILKYNEDTKSYSIENFGTGF